MRTVEIQLRAHRYLIYFVVILVPVAVLAMVNTFYDSLEPMYRGALARTGSLIDTYDGALSEAVIEDMVLTPVRDYMVRI